MTDAYDQALTKSAVEIGDEGPVVVIENLERKDFVKYAGASGDFNPIHYDDPYAKSAGNESVFAQGMFTAGIGAHMVADWFGLDNVRQYGVRFQSRVFPGDRISVTGEITDIDGDIVEADIVAKTDEEVVLTGTATAELSG